LAVEKDAPGTPGQGACGVMFVAMLCRCCMMRKAMLLVAKRSCPMHGVRPAVCIRNAMRKIVTQWEYVHPSAV